MLGLLFVIYRVGILGLSVFVVLVLVLVGLVMRPFLGTPKSWQPVVGAAPNQTALTQPPCADNTPLRRAYFGDLHVHTALSWDGSGRGMYTMPDQAYRFAKGAAIGLPPYDAKGDGTRTVQLDRPLDFAAVTDHAESIGEVSLCITPGSSGYDTDNCSAFRGERAVFPFPKWISPMAAIMSSKRSDALCGSDGALCREATVDAWAVTRKAAEDWYDRSDDCSFTTFHAYEYTYAPDANRVHRNVIFRNEVVPELPISTADEAEPEGLWRRLKSLCLDTAGDCDVLAIPHNPNHASGYMFPLSDPSEPLDVRQERAQLRADMEPLVEMMQIKGESECRNGLWGVTGAPDEFCDLEKYVPTTGVKDCEGGLGFGKSLGLGCVARTDYARYTIAAGLAEERSLGVNPYRLGFIGSTDTHNGVPGDVEEWNFAGSTGLGDATPEKRLKARIQRNPGGLVGIWAEENSRDGLFDAMRRREVFATSGPRMTVRFFAGWNDFAANDESNSNWCDRPDAMAGAYASGVPMGGQLSDVGQQGEAPYFAVRAHRDPGTAEHPGGLLERVQIIKVQATEDGNFHQQVFDVAGGPTGAGVHSGSCEPYGPGADSLCAVWQDPEFDSEASAAYYVRAIENPSCRWTTWSCLALPEQERPALCYDENEAKLTQERIWSSPIWYQQPSA